MLACLEAAESVEPMCIDTVDTAWEMMKSREYQNAKCEYGSEDSSPTFSVAIPGLRKSYRNELMEIMNGQLWFDR